MGRHLDPGGHVYNLIPFETPSDLETGNSKEQMAGSNVEIAETSARVMNYTFISENHTQNQLYFNPNNGIHVSVSYMSDQWRR